MYPPIKANVVSTTAFPNVRLDMTVSDFLLHLHLPNSIRFAISGSRTAALARIGRDHMRANCQFARMAGMFGGPDAEDRPEVEADEDGTMPPMEPLAATGEDAVRWAEEDSSHSCRDVTGTANLGPLVMDFDEH